MVAACADLLHWRPARLPVSDVLSLGFLEPVGFLLGLSSSASFHIVVLGSNTQTAFHALRRTPTMHWQSGSVLTAFSYRI